MYESRHLIKAKEFAMHDLIYYLLCSFACICQGQGQNVTQRLFLYFLRRGINSKEE